MPTYIYAIFFDLFEDGVCVDNGSQTLVASCEVTARSRFLAEYKTPYDVVVTDIKRL